MLFARDSLKIQDENSLKMKEQKKIFHANTNQKTIGVATLSEKIDFKFKNKLQEKKKDIIYQQKFNTARKYNYYKYLCI